MQSPKDPHEVQGIWVRTENTCKKTHSQKDKQTYTESCCLAAGQSPTASAFPREALMVLYLPAPTEKDAVFLGFTKKSSGS